MLAWLYAGGPAVSHEWRLLHASLQIFGFFGALIAGVAPHLIARFTGHATSQPPRAHQIFGLMVAGLLLRTAGTWAALPWAVLAGAGCQATAFLLVAAWVWRALDPAPLAALRRQLTASSGWLAGACLLETILRWRALRAGLPMPSTGAMRAVEAMALLAGVTGWIAGVLLRAGPMFAPRWRVAPWFARALPWALGLGAALAAAGESADAPAVARLGELCVVGTVAALFVGCGVLRVAPEALPLAGRSAEESRIFRLALASLGAALVGSLAAAALAWCAIEAPLLGDAVRHLIAVGFLTAIAVAMTFRLIPVLEGRALPWPRLRAAAFWALAAGVTLRSAETLLGFGWAWLAPGVALSGLCVWAALLCVGANLVWAVTRRP